MNRCMQIRCSLLRVIAVPLMAVVIGATSLAGAPAASASVVVAGIGADAVGTYSCSTGKVEIEPWATSSDMANPGVWARAQVFDYATGQWIIGDWYPADGITQLTFTVTNPYLVAYVYFAAWDGTAWQTSSEDINITSDLDNGFCSI